ncbi:MAG: DUF1177 domain-containing protein [Dehalococcoidales bacterium]|nr:DUF1177 domain-containing protein [Dehalococcoidales bacterium]
MAWRQVIDAFELLDSAHVDGQQVADALHDLGIGDVQVTRIEGPQGHTDFLKAVIPGAQGKASGGEAPTLGVIGRLGGLGARPERIGFVSDGDGALTAVSFAMNLGAMRQRGDTLPGDVIVATHICPNAPTQPHEPVPFMGSPVDMAQMNRHEVDERMDAVLSVDTTKGNRIINLRGFAISPTVKQGYILRVSEDLLELMQIVTGKLPAVFAITTQDITPYGNGVFHVNSILQPCTATKAPVVGVAITAEVPVPGCATGATHLEDVESAVRFCAEVAKAYGAGKCSFHDEAEYARLEGLYGSMAHLQTMGRERV